MESPITKSLVVAFGAAVAPGTACTAPPLQADGWQAQVELVVVACMWHPLSALGTARRSRQRHSRPPHWAWQSLSLWQGSPTCGGAGPGGAGAGGARAVRADTRPGAGAGGPTLAKMSQLWLVCTTFTSIHSHARHSSLYAPWQSAQQAAWSDTLVEAATVEPTNKLVPGRSVSGQESPPAAGNASRAVISPSLSTRPVLLAIVVRTAIIAARRADSRDQKVDPKIA